MAIREETRRAVRRKKRREDSSSDVIDRTTSDTGRLRDCYGAWKMDDDEAREILNTLDRYWHAAIVQLRRGVKRRS